QSQLAGTPNEREACRFLEAKLANDPQRRPQLIIANNPHPMNELLMPVVPWMYLEPQNQVKSSRPLTVWALLDSTASAELRHRLDEHSRVERVDVSAGFPWEFLIITFP